MEKTGAPDQSAEEVQLMQAAQKDLRQFSVIYDRYFPRIYAYCLRRVNNAQEAEDLARQINACKQLIIRRELETIFRYRGE